MRIDDLNEPPEAQLAKRLKRQEAADPIGYSSVSEGRLRIASEEGLLVEGSARVDGYMRVDGMQEVFGQLEIEGTLEGYRDTSGAPPYFYWEGDLEFGNGANLVFRDARAGADNLGDLADGMYVLACNNDGSKLGLYKWTRPAGNVGGGPYTGGWPRSPFSWDSFNLNNLDGESDYGERSTGKGWHDGIDYGAAGVTYGSVITAVGPGVTIGTGYVDEWGGYQGVIIQHDQIDQGSLAGKQLYSVYAHCQTRYVEPGTRVDTGTPIGEVGNEGESLGAHLHLELHIGSLYMYGDPGVGGSQDPVPIFNEYGGWP